MTTTPPTEVEFPGLSGVLEWEIGLLARYRSRDLESSPMQRSRMETLKVTTIRRFKQRKRAGRGYLVAEVFDPDLGQNRYLRIERCVDADFSHTHSIPPTSSQSSLVLKKSPAVDYVKAISAWPTDGICIDNLTCRGSQMIVLDLAIVAKVVHEHSVEYHVLTSQCWWYSAVIVSVLRKSFKFPQVKGSNKASSSKADYGQGLEMKFSDKKGGTYRSIPIYSERPEVITEIYDRFKTYKDQIYSSITEAAQYVEQKMDADRRMQKETEEAQKAIEGMQKENERVQKETEEAQKAIEGIQKETERIQKETEEAQKAIEDAERRVNEAQKENAALKQRMQDIEAKLASGGGSHR